MLGTGQRLFGPGDDLRTFQLVGSAATGTGVLMTTYRSTVPTV